MFTGERVLDQGLRALCLSDGGREFEKLGFHQPPARVVSSTAGGYECASLWEGESGVPAEPDQGDPLGARRTVVSSFVHPSIWGQ
jgi:hypothetical protein